MIFSSFEFIFFFLPLLLFIYYLAYKSSINVKNFILMIGSFLFYAWGEPVWVILLLFSATQDYICGRVIGNARKNGTKYVARVMLIVSITTNLALLGTFKYLDFFLENLGLLFRFTPELTGLALPIGISFYTFQTLSYTIDVYRGKVEVQKSYSNFLLFVSLFPSLVAGPIIRYESISDQISNRTFNWDDFSSGLKRFIIGIGKKLIIADTIAHVAEYSFSADPATLSVTAAWLGAAAFGMQIYFDFSGYSDMAIGLGKMFGFHFLENFNFPYISRSISDFWRRWHISLSTWFRDYVYFPLGGSRVKSKFRLVFNLFIVWALTGLWHGAAWNFVFWGLFFFVLIMFEKVTGFDKWAERVPVLSNIYMLVCVLIGWVLFRAEGIGHAWEYLLAMFGLQANPFFGTDTLRIGPEFIITWIIGIIACIPVSKIFSSARFTESLPAVIIRWVLVIFILLLSFAIMSGNEQSPFIYFAF
ncbi:MAG: MBOAT family protein [Oscillospiraceae bacterium]|nr:MBOAT family protein [Oscillospiraceae bacterium]